MAKIRPLMKPDTRGFLRQMILAWATIIAAIMISEHFQRLWITIPVLMIIATRQNILGLLVHEQVHLLGARSRGWADILTNLFCAYPLFISVECYGNVHLSHHRFFFTNKDPDYHRKQGDEWTFPQRMEIFIKTLLLDISGVNLGKTINGKSDAQKLGEVLISKTAYVRWIRLGFYAGLAASLTAFHGWGFFLFYWFVPLATFLQIIVRWGAIAEHKYNLISPTVAEATPIIELAWWEKLILPNLNFTLHIYHHYWPSIPASRLEKVHEIFKQAGLVNNQNVFHGNLDYLRFLFSNKTPQSIPPRKDQLQFIRIQSDTQLPVGR